MLAKRPFQPTLMLADRLLSRASPLPHWIDGEHSICVATTVPVKRRCRQDEGLQVRTQEADRDRSVYCRSNRRASRGSACCLARACNHSAESGAQALSQGSRRAGRGAACSVSLPRVASDLPLPGRSPTDHSRLCQGPVTGNLQRHRHPSPCLPQIPAGTTRSVDARLHRDRGSRRQSAEHSLPVRGRAGR